MYCKFGNFRENFFFRELRLKDVFATFKIPDKDMIYIYQ